MSNLIRLTCKAVLFDMDGTLVDSTVVVEHAWRLWADRHSLSLEEVLAFSHGRPMVATFEHFRPGQDHTADATERAYIEETETDGITAIPGAAQLLEGLSSHPWAIVTSAWRTLAEVRVISAGLPLPDVIVPIDEIRNGKPDPEGFLRAAERLAVAPEECLVFEDTRPGIEAGLNAGMQVVGLLTTFPAQKLGHSLAIRDYHDMTLRSRGEVLELDLRNQA